MVLEIELEQEWDGMFIAAIASLPGCACRGMTEDEAIKAVLDLAFVVICESHSGEWN